MTTEIVKYQMASKRVKLQNQRVTEGFEDTDLLTINQQLFASVHDTQKM